MQALVAPRRTAQPRDAVLKAKQRQKANQQERERPRIGQAIFAGDEAGRPEQDEKGLQPELSRTASLRPGCGSFCLPHSMTRNSNPEGALLEGLSPAKSTKGADHPLCQIKVDRRPDTIASR